MKTKAKQLALGLGFLVLISGAGATLNSCSRAKSQTLSIKIDGSSTVFPITEAVAKEFQKTQAEEIEIKVDFTGTGGGFRKFCAGETDISNASRPIQPKEMEACRNAGVPYIELPIAFDALTVVVNAQNTWAKDITLAELQKMWAPDSESKLTRWQQIRPSWPDKPLNLFGPGKNSGTFDYFTEAVVGQAKASRNDYIASEDDNALVQGVSKDPNALGYFGYAYYEANQNQLKPLGVGNGKEPVLPSLKTVENAEYQPLSRPLLIYVNAKSAQTKPEVKAFVDFYLKNASAIVKSVGYVALPDEGYRLGEVHFHRGKIGTVFDGKAQFNLTLGELLRKQEKF